MGLKSPLPLVSVQSGTVRTAGVAGADGFGNLIVFLLARISWAGSSIVDKGEDRADVSGDSATAGFTVCACDKGL